MKTIVDVGPTLSMWSGSGQFQVDSHIFMPYEDEEGRWGGGFIGSQGDSLWANPHAIVFGFGASVQLRQLAIRLAL